jgi:mRNA deadenylase 3'-5' endonuclease subunit Ccr4
LTSTNKQTNKQKQINAKILIEKKTESLRKSARVHIHTKQQQKYHQKFLRCISLYQVTVSEDQERKQGEPMQECCQGKTAL